MVWGQEASHKKGGGFGERTHGGDAGMSPGAGATVRYHRGRWLALSRIAIRPAGAELLGTPLPGAALGAAHGPHPLRRCVQTQRSQRRAFSCFIVPLLSARFLSPFENKLTVVYSIWNFSKSL